jgi:FkbM family methyltransferase
MPMITYAQNREDVLLNRVFAGRGQGFYIDVGANDPTACSVTRHFYGLGWHGINVEPAGAAFRRLAAARGRDVNLNVGLSKRPGSLWFYESPTASTLSTFSADEAAAHARRGHAFVRRRVPVTTLARVCRRYVSGPIDFLSIDVENHEREVIEGGDWRRWRPRVVLVEDYIPANGVPSHGRWEPLLLAADYHFAFFDGINRFYVRAEDRQLLPLLRTPANVLDDFIPYEYQRQIDYLQGLLAARGQTPGPMNMEELGPLTRAVARRLQRLEARYPRLAGAVRSLGASALAGLRGVS